MKKICFIIDSFRFGGAQKVTANIADALADAGFKVDVIIYRNKIDLDLNNKFEIKYIEILGLSRNGIIGKVDGLLLRLFGRLYQYCSAHIYSYLLGKQVNFDSYSHTFLCSDSGFFPFHKLQIKSSTFILHSKKSEQYAFSKIKILNEFFIKKFRKVFYKRNIITVSTGIKNDLVDVFNVAEEQISVIYNFVDEKAALLLSEQKNVCLDFEPYICHVGRHSKEKRIDVLLDAFEMLSLEDINLVLIGDGPEHNRLKEKAEKSPYKDRIKFLGFLQNPFPVIKNAKALVLSSEREGLPTVLIEALYLQTPVISTDCETGPSEIMVGTFENFLCGVNNPADLADKIMILINEGADMKFDFVECTSKFQKERIVKKYKKYIECKRDERC